MSCNDDSDLTFYARHLRSDVANTRRVNGKLVTNSHILSDILCGACGMRWVYTTPPTPCPYHGKKGVWASDNEDTKR